MPAPKGNRYGEEHWIKPMSDEGFVTVSVRLPKSHVAKLDSMVRPGQVRSDLLRQAIAYYLEERKQI